MKQILNKYLSLLFFIGFIVNTSYAGGKESESSNLMMASDYYGSYSISLGQLDWNKNTNTASNEPMLYQPISIDGWLGKKLSQYTEGVLSFKYTYYGRSGNTGQPEDDGVRHALNANLLHLRHYSSSTSYINLGYVFSEENENSSSNSNMNSYIASGGLATESMIFELGIASTATETRSYYADEIVYYNFSYKLPITNRINLLASKHYSEYERKLRTETYDGEEMDISGLKVTYDLNDSFITLGGDRYTVKNDSSPENTGGSVYFSWTVPFGKLPNSRTSFILDNRPAVDRVIGFGSALN